MINVEMLQNSTVILIFSPCNVLENPDRDAARNVRYDFESFDSSLHS